MSVETFWPAPAEDEQPLPDYGYESAMAPMVTDGVIGVPGDNSCQVYAAPSGAFIKPGRITIRGRVYELDGDDKALTVTTNSSGSTRYDLVRLRLDPSGSPRWNLSVVAGSTFKPTGQRSSDLSEPTDVRLAVLTVPQGASIPSSAEDIRDFAGMDYVPCRSVNDIPENRRRVGMLAYEATAGRLRQWNGASWRTFQYADESGGSFTPGYSGFSLGSGSVREGRYFPVAQNLWKVKARIKTGSGASFAAGPIEMGLPPGFSADMTIPDHGRALAIPASGSNSHTGAAIVSSAVAVALRGEESAWSQGTPFTFTPGTEFRYDLLVTRA